MFKRGKDGIDEIMEEDKVTLYRMHPDQKTYFGAIIVAPNIPNSPLKMRDYKRRGNRLNPENLPWVQENDADIVYDGNGEPWAVPQGYKLEGSQEELREPIRDGAYRVAGYTTVFKVVKAETSQEFACDICGKEVKTKLALSGHKKTHKIK